MTHIHTATTQDQEPVGVRVHVKRLSRDLGTRGGGGGAVQVQLQTHNMEVDW